MIFIIIILLSGELLLLLLLFVADVIFVAVCVIFCVACNLWLLC